MRLCRGAVRNWPDKFAAWRSKFWHRRADTVHHGAVPIDAARLPDDPALLQHMLRELHAENDKLRLLIQRFMRHRFGRRSEQLTLEQLQFGLEDQEQAIAEQQAAQDATEPSGGAKPKARPTRPSRNHGALPSHLPRYEVVIDVEHGACPCCGGGMHCIGELRTEQLDICCRGIGKVRPRRRTAIRRAPRPHDRPSRDHRAFDCKAE